MAVPSIVIRVASQEGTWPPCSGRSAYPERFIDGDHTLPREKAHGAPDKLRSFRVSGSSETKTYGKGVAPREYEEQPTLPRRSIFGKDIDERACISAIVQPSPSIHFGAEDQ
jgi:hypothetical protein